VSWPSSDSWHPLLTTARICDNVFHLAGLTTVTKQNSYSAATNPYVLIVDDSGDGREMVEEYLRFRGFRVVAVASGQAALTQAFESTPALILMDLQMPGITGWEATRQLKANLATKDVVVIALSAHALVTDEAAARQAGCDAFIPKPFDIVALGIVVANVLTHGRAGLTMRAGSEKQTRKSRRA
jgi:two-component system cell cycle response regulator DivK